MRRISYHTMHAVAILASLTCVLIVTPTMSASTANEAVISYANSIQGYNLVTFGGANLGTNSKVDASVAVRGNLYIGSGSEIAREGSLYSSSSSSLSLYVGGQLSIGSDVKIQNGYVSTPNQSGWTRQTGVGNNQVRFNGGGGWLNLDNSKDSNRAANPGTNSASPNWAWQDLQTTLAAASKTLASVTSTAAIIRTGQTLSVSVPSGSTGVVVVTLDMNLFKGNLYDINGDGVWDQNNERISEIKIDVPSDVNLVINVVNAKSDSALFQVNVNGGANNDQLLWNIVPSTTTGTQAITLLGNNATQFYGSILAPMVDLTLGDNTKVYGQVVANSYTQGSNALLTYNGGFNSVVFSPVPEPQTWGLMMVGAGVFVLGLKSWRDRKRKQMVASQIA